MKILTIVGARPQFIKAAAFSQALGKCNKISKTCHEQVLVHTGQHYDSNMAQVFFDELGIPKPKYQLGISGLSHGAMTGRMIEKLEEVMLGEAPDCILLYGDTNSTLAGAISATKLHLPIAHIEAGLRSYNMQMPEEINRILSDRVSTLLFCPTQTSVENLKKEGLVENVFQIGDVMYDIALNFRDNARSQHELSKWNVEEKSYVLATVHREENTDDKNRLKEIFEALGEIAKTTTVLLPLHPRTKKCLEAFSLNGHLDRIQVVAPLSYLEMTRLEMSAAAIFTDSGGVQKEAFFHRVPCHTLRSETEWVETLELGWNVLVGADKDKILESWRNVGQLARKEGKPYGDGDSSEKIVRELENFFREKTQST